METYYIEVHRAKESFKLIKETMSLLDKVNMNQIIKSAIKVDLNKVLQYLSLPNLKLVVEKEEV